jgi:hypothetical protein
MHATWCDWRCSSIHEESWCRAAIYAETLGLSKIHGNDSMVIFDTCQAKIDYQQIDADDPEAIRLVSRFTALSFTVSSMESVLNELAGRPIDCSVNASISRGVASCRSSRIQMAIF